MNTENCSHPIHEHIDRVIKSLIRRYVAPLLDEHGFRKAGLHWNRNGRGIVHVFDIQLGRQNSPKNAVFTINLGVLVETVWRAVKNVPVPSTVKELDCFPRVRVGYLLSDGPLYDDIWWTLNDLIDIDSVGRELTEIVKHKCMPFFAGLDTAEAVLELAENPFLRRFPMERLNYAALKFVTGQRRQSAELLSDILADTKLEAWHPLARSVLERLATLP